MRPQSAKSKGRRFQQYIRDLLLKFAPSLEMDDVRSTAMGAGGEDIQLSPAARKIYPYTIECKNVERLNMWEAVDQAQAHAVKDGRGHIPLVAFKKNGRDAWIAMPAEQFMELIREKC